MRGFGQGWTQLALMALITTPDLTGLTDNQGLIMPGGGERVMFSEGGCLENNFCHPASCASGLPASAPRC